MSPSTRSNLSLHTPRDGVSAYLYAQSRPPSVPAIGPLRQGAPAGLSSARAAPPRPPHAELRRLRGGGGRPDPPPSRAGGRARAKTGAAGGPYGAGGPPEGERGAPGQPPSCGGRRGRRGQPPFRGPPRWLLVREGPGMSPPALVLRFLQALVLLRTRFWRR